MRNNLLWGAVALAVIILLVVLFGSGYDNSSYTPNTTTYPPASHQSTTNTSTKTTAPKPISGMQTSLGGIFDVQGSYECDYNSVSNSSQTANVVYVSNGKLRGEFRTIAAGASKSTLVVYDGSYLYTWTEGYPTGTISQPKTLADLPGIIPQDVSSGKILGSGLSSVSWYCHPWSVVPSLLQKPSYVKFY